MVSYSSVPPEELTYLLERTRELGFSLHHIFNNPNKLQENQAASLLQLLEEILPKIPSDIAPAMAFIKCVCQQIEENILPTRDNVLASLYYLNVPPLSLYLSNSAPVGGLRPMMHQHHSPYAHPLQYDQNLYNEQIFNQRNLNNNYPGPPYYPRQHPQQSGFQLQQLQPSPYQAPPEELPSRYLQQNEIAIESVYHDQRDHEQLHPNIHGIHQQPEHMVSHKYPERFQGNFVLQDESISEAHPPSQPHHASPQKYQSVIDGQYSDLKNDDPTLKEEFLPININFFSGQTLDSSEQNLEEISPSRVELAQGVNVLSPKALQVLSTTYTEEDIPREDSKRNVKLSPQVLEKEKHQLSLNSQVTSPNQIERRIDIDPNVFKALEDLRVVQDIENETSTEISSSQEGSYIVVKGEPRSVVAARDAVLLVESKLRKTSLGTEKKSADEEKEVQVSPPHVKLENHKKPKEKVKVFRGVTSPMISKQENSAIVDVSLNKKDKRLKKKKSKKLL